VSNELSNIGPLFGRGTTGYEHVTSWRMALLGGVSDAKTALCLLWQARFSRLLVHTYLPAPAKAPPRRAKTCDVRGGAALVLHEEGILAVSQTNSCTMHPSTLSALLGFAPHLFSGASHGAAKQGFLGAT